MNVPFYKCNGNGNSFIILVYNNLSIKHFPKYKIKEICRINNQQLVDGFISINYNNENIIINYYNNDGSWETFCLNGLRCVSLIMKHILNKNNFDIFMNDIIYKTKIDSNNNIAVYLGMPKYEIKNIIIDDLMGNYINSGAKHFVCNYTKEWHNPMLLKKEMQSIRNNKIFMPNGINVNYYKILDKNTIEIKTYEKGIEKIMQSCASGSYACAYDYSRKNNINGKIKVLNDGGISQITFSKCYTNNLFKAEAEIEYKGSIEI